MGSLRIFTFFLLAVMVSYTMAAVLPTKKTTTTRAPRTTKTTITRAPRTTKTTTTRAPRTTKTTTTRKPTTTTSPPTTNAPTKPTNCEERQDSSDPCYTCTCVNNEKMCYYIDCAPTQCVDGYTKPGDCCMTCPNGRNCAVEGRVIPYGSQVNVEGIGKCFCFMNEQEHRLFAVCEPPPPPPPPSPPTPPTTPPTSPPTSPSTPSSPPSPPTPPTTPPTSPPTSPPAPPTPTTTTTTSTPPPTTSANCQHFSKPWGDDPCQYCFCDGGQYVCYIAGCPARCRNNVRKPGECCPECPYDWTSYPPQPPTSTRPPYPPQPPTSTLARDIPWYYTTQAPMDYPDATATAD